MAQRHDCKDGEDANGDEDAFHDAGRDVAEREDLVLPLEERDQLNRGADVRDDQDQFQERPEVDAVVGTASGDVALGIVENGLEEEKRRDRGGEGGEVKQPKRQRNPSMWAHEDPLSSLKAAILAPQRRVASGARRVARLRTEHPTSRHRSSVPWFASSSLEQAPEQRLSSLRRRRYERQVILERASSGALSVEILQELVCCKLDLLVPPLRGTVVVGDQPHPVQTAEVAVDKRVARLRLLGRTLGEAEMPGGVFVPGVRFEEFVLLPCARLHVLPARAENVLACVDQLLRMPDSVRVQCVGGHARILAEGWRDVRRASLRSARLGGCRSSRDLCSCAVEATKAEAVADDRDARERHRGACDERVRRGSVDRLARLRKTPICSEFHLRRLSSKRTNCTARSHRGGEADPRGGNGGRADWRRGVRNEGATASAFVASTAQEQRSRDDLHPPSLALRSEARLTSRQPSARIRACPPTH